MLSYKIQNGVNMWFPVSQLGRLSKMLRALQLTRNGSWRGCIGLLLTADFAMCQHQDASCRRVDSRLQKCFPLPSDLSGSSCPRLRSAYSGQSCTVWLPVCASGTWEVFISSSSMTVKPELLTVTVKFIKMACCFYKHSHINQRVVNDSTDCFIMVW